MGVELKPSDQSGRWADIGHPQEPRQGGGLLRQRFYPTPRSQAPDQSDSSQALPSMVHLMQVTPGHPSQGSIPFPSQGPLGPFTPRDHAHPDFVPLPQEGWRAVGVLVAQRGPLLKERQILTRRLQGLMEEVERCALGSSER